MKFNKVEANFKPTEDGKCAVAGNGMIATAFPEATRAGVEILRAQGNAVDASCAAALALGVCEPQASGIGGQTMMLLYTGKKIIAIDGSSRAPSLAHVKAIYKTDRSAGYRATTVPSTLATLGYVHKVYGKLPWHRICEPAIRIATDGYKITDLQHRLLVRETDKFDSVESKSGKRYFFKNGLPYQSGESFKQPDLAAMLKRIAEKGVEEFYTGKIAKQIDADMRENGGLLRNDDLALIPWPIERKPLSGKFRGLKIFSMPPPGAGRTLLYALAMINALTPKQLNKDPVIRTHLLAEIFRKTLLERFDRPFDPNFYPQVNEKEMLSQKYASDCVKDIFQSVVPKLPIRETEDELTGETTHLSAMDQYGMAVSLTQSIERVYGSKAAADGLGFLYNNYIMDFDYVLPSHPFYLRPNAVPWATVTPTLVFNHKQLWMAMGSPGSERIMSALAQFLIHITDENMPISEAMEAPRLHCSLGGKINIEAERFPDQVLRSLKEKGYRIKIREPYAFYLGAIHAVLKCQDGDGFQGVAEIRRDGSAGGI